ncbi:hypothetical protein [Hydrogenovibrio marinus]|uniref:Uncharacterized protein n=1 Tax=Hydrogenovibrio marinus TaxID=28885 RepID=A0A066ZM92_HYDMR|nr:hypothetical protein [Hydrogenovibrio marinus]KDN94617.1 hypothetical protein EI16_11985 [Hydrogenovibrio marinus]
MIQVMIMVVISMVLAAWGVESSSLELGVFALVVAVWGSAMYVGEALKPNAGKKDELSSESEEKSV